MELRPYQKEGVAFLKARKFAILGDEMRVGKTPQAILAAKAVEAATINVVCPAIGVAHWDNEFHKWGGCADYRIVSYDYATTHDLDPCDVLIVDEFHYCKNPNAKRTKAIFGKGGAASKAQHIWCLSGTPAVNHAADLWVMLYTFGVTRLPYHGFIRRYCYMNQWGEVRGTRAEHKHEVREMLQSIMLRRTRMEVAPEMPEIDFNLFYVEPETEGLDAFLLEVAGGMPIALRAEVERQLEALEITTPDLSDRNKYGLARAFCAAAKVKGLADEIRANIACENYNQTVVFGHYRMPLEYLYQRLKGDGIATAIIYGSTTPARRTEIQREFLGGRLQVVIGNLQAAGVAIDLSAARHGYFLEQDWVPGNNWQAAARLMNMEKLDPVTFDVVTWKGSVDEVIQGVILRKTRELSGVF